MSDQREDIVRVGECLKEEKVFVAIVVGEYQFVPAERTFLPPRTVTLYHGKRIRFGNGRELP